MGFSSTAKVRSALAMLVAVSILGACGTANTATSKPHTITLRLADANHDGDFEIAIDHHFADLVKEASQGRIDVEVIDGGQLGGEATNVSHVHDGTIDFATVATWNVGSYVKPMSLLGGLFLFLGWRGFERAWKDPEVLAAMQKTIRDAHAGFQLLAWEGVGTMDLFGRKPFTTLDALKGVKIGIPDNKLDAETWKNLGMVTTTISFNELYTGFQTNLVQAAMHSPKSIYSSKLQEVAPDITLTQTLVSTAAILESDRTRGQLSAADQRLVETAATEAAAWGTAASPKVEQETIAKLKQMPGVVIYPRPKDLASWVTQVAPINAAYARSLGATGLYQLINKDQEGLSATSD